MQRGFTPLGMGASYWDRSDPVGVWRWLLSSGAMDATGLRWWALWIWWSKPRSLGERLRATADLLLFPFAALNEARLHVQYYGGKVSEVYGISTARQFRDIVRLQLYSGQPPIAYYRYHLFLPEHRAVAHQYIENSTRFLQVLRRRVPATDDALIFNDKRRFERWCRTNHLACVGTLIEVDGGAVLYRAEGELPAADLFSKPSNWHSGRGIERWRHVSSANGASAWVGNDGVACDGDALCVSLQQRSSEYGRPIILQPLLANHRIIAELGNGLALCTLRIMTLRRCPSAKVELLLAVLRIATGCAHADNFDLGGLAAPVDAGTGKCGGAVFMRGSYPLDRFEVNPVNGKQIAGIELPFWREAMALAMRAHNLVRYDLPVIGWDVAITESGPVLMEANDLPGGEIAQMPTGIALGETNYARYLIEDFKSLFNVN